jgi:acetylornithine deacetylase/succinyl-diaminopimelate desuccinylase-like protein
MPYVVKDGVASGPGVFDMKAGIAVAIAVLEALAELSDPPPVTLLLTPDEEAGTGAYVDYTGMPSRAELLEYYAVASGRPVDDIDYYVVLARFKLAVVLEAGYARAVRGSADNPKMLAFGDVVLLLARRAGELAARSSL